MELRHLRYFTAVVQWKGYREASRHLYITQPSISEAVSDLESELGIKLFSRDGRVSRLTPEGQVFYEEAIKTLWGERANQQFQDVLRATVCLSASVPALGRTRHPFAVSGLEGPSPKIEFVFSASPETIRREPREGNLLRSVGNMQDLAVCAFCSSCLF